MTALRGSDRRSRELNAFDVEANLGGGECPVEMRCMRVPTLFSRSSHQLGQVFSTQRFSSMIVSFTTVPRTLNAIATRWSS